MLATELQRRVRLTFCLGPSIKIAAGGSNQFMPMRTIIPQCRQQMPHLQCAPVLMTPEF